MENSDLIEQARQLRADGLSIKKIARALGVPPARAAELVNTADDEGDGDVIGCWVSPGWSDGLILAEPGRWPDAPKGGAPSGGLANVLLATQARAGQAWVVGYLLDVYCLGVKNVVGPRLFDGMDLPPFLESFFAAYPGSPLVAPLDLAQHLVHGAVDYARTLGFPPARGFRDTVDHLGTATGASGITFGRDGEPFYFEGPHDDAATIVRTLDRTVGAGNYGTLLATA